VIASVSDDSEDDELDDSSAEIAAFKTPLPRPSPIPTHSQPAPVVVATAQPVPQHFQQRDQAQFAFASIGAADMAPRRAAPFEFESASHWSTPSVPAELARAMAKRDVSRATATSLPIRPTAVVAKIDVSRPLRAEAITSAVMQQGGSGGSVRDVTPVFAYAATMEASTPAPRPTYQAEDSDLGAPVPVANPMWASAAPVAVAIAAPVERPVTRRLLPRQDLTLTALDTLGLRLWMASQSTRQKQYAVLTMPDFSQMPSLIDKPVVAYSAGFSRDAYQGLRTDRFSGPVARLPSIVDLQSRQRLAYR
jgi:hypothetical protein